MLGGPRTGHTRVRLPTEERDFLLLQNIQSESEALPTSYSMGMGFFPLVKADGT